MTDVSAGDGEGCCVALMSGCRFSSGVAAGTESGCSCEGIAAGDEEETDEEKQASAAWERRQLEIMEWITNDVDGLTGEHHPPCVRLGWHQ